uniref:Nucleoside-diphosphate kinase n=1 Tax=Oncorhynchus mykiss TaxID=8022 RepID=A0A8C7WK05_ONCMY
WCLSLETAIRHSSGCCFLASSPSPPSFSSPRKAQVVFVLGGPGSGKGTQCVRIVETRRRSTSSSTASPETKNLYGWTTIMDGEADVKFVLVFDCSNEKEGKSSGRTDDNRASLEKRTQTYLQSTRPVISLYEKQGKVRTVDASYSVDKVFANVKTILDKEN